MFRYLINQYFSKGKCEQAIVGGTNINLQAFTNYLYQNCRFNSLDGISRVWDEEADGFVRGETVCCLFLQRKSKAKRIYATVLHSQTNIDGNKNNGMFFPLSESQRDLMFQTYKEANVDPSKLTYFEAHGTGTKVIVLRFGS
jgi:fatty acid synthase